MESKEEKTHRVIFSLYVRWLETAGEPMTISELSEATGLTRQTLTTILSKKKFKMPRMKTIIALAKVWGDDLYEKLGIEKPATKSKSLDKVWSQLPEDIKKQVNSLIEPYAEK
jgi:transcriptional regulator with XRE-family HTH domain